MGPQRVRANLSVTPWQVRTPMLILTVHTAWHDGSAHEYTFELTKDDLDGVLASFSEIASEIRKVTSY